MSEQINVQWLPVAELKIDATYQRKMSIDKVRAMVRKWDAGAVDIVVVSQRIDGYYVIDGQHRVAAAKILNVSHLRCEIIQDATPDREAELFLIKNANRKPPTKMQLHKALLASQDATARVVEGLATQAGRKIDYGGSGQPDIIRCVGALYTVVQDNEVTFRRVWPLIIELCEGRNIDERLVLGFGYAERNLDDNRSFAETAIHRRLVRMGWIRLNDFINRAASAHIRGGEKAWAEGVLNAANHSVADRNRLRFKGKP